MIPALVVSAAFAADPTPARARYQMLVASWEQAHGNPDAAATAARTALLHAPNAGAPRVLLASLHAHEPGTLTTRLGLLEAAALDPSASAAAFTALGAARAANGDDRGANAAFLEAELRGGGSANYAGWIGALQGTAPTWPTEAGREALARWRAAGGPDVGYYAAFASAVLMESSPASRSEACESWRAAAATGESVDAQRVVDVCGVDGSAELTQITLTYLRDRGVTPR